MGKQEYMKWGSAGNKKILDHFFICYGENNNKDLINKADFKYLNCLIHVFWIGEYFNVYFTCYILALKNV